MLVLRKSNNASCVSKMYIPHTLEVLVRSLHNAMQCARSLAKSVNDDQYDEYTVRYIITSEYGQRAAVTSIDQKACENVLEQIEKQWDESAPYLYPVFQELKRQQRVSEICYSVEDVMSETELYSSNQKWGVLLLRVLNLFVPLLKPWILDGPEKTHMTEVFQSVRTWCAEFMKNYQITRNHLFLSGDRSVQFKKVYKPEHGVEIKDDASDELHSTSKPQRLTHRLDTRQHKSRRKTKTRKHNKRSLPGVQQANWIKRPRQTHTQTMDTDNSLPYAKGFLIACALGMFLLIAGIITASVLLHQRRKALSP